MSYHLSDLNEELEGVKGELAELQLKLDGMENETGPEAARKYVALRARQLDLRDTENALQSDIDEIMDREAAAERRADWSYIQGRTL